MAGRTNMKDKKLEEAIDYVCSCCPYIFSGSAEWNKSNPAFAGWRERYGELYINASDEELVRQGKRTYGEELTRLYDLDLSGWRVIGHYGCGRGYEGRSWYDMGKPFGRR